jgi:hypothetical protein
VTGKPDHAALVSRHGIGVDPQVVMATFVTELPDRIGNLFERPAAPLAFGAQ